MYNLIQSQIFHLVSMLICIAVVAWLLVSHFFKSEAKGDDRIRLLNTLYISGILAFIIIELVTAICMNNSSHADILSFVSFAATLSSLILSIVAIIFTIVSGKNGEAQYQKLDKVSDDVKHSLNEFSEKTFAIDESVVKFQRIADYLSEQIREVYDKLSGLEMPINQMKEQLLPNIAGEGKDIKKKEVDKGESFVDKVTNFITLGSFSGNLALLACVLAKDKKRSFNMADIQENDSGGGYKFGYIIASSAMGVITAKVKDDAIIEVLDYYEGLHDMLEKALENYIAGVKEDASRDYCRKRLNAIKKFFE